MKVDVGIIGGTGIGERLLTLGGKTLFVPTPAGVLRGQTIEVDGVTILIVGRHSAGHKVPPHKVNYRAMAHGMKQLGVVACLSTAAVGCLRREWPAGTLVVCSDFLDFTYRSQTMFDQTVVHTDFTNPFGPASRSALQTAAYRLGHEVRDGGVYLSSNGPRFETPKEISLYHQFGADLVGMTAATEAILMREAGVDYGCLAIVTNLAAGISDSPISHEEVLDEMKRSGPKAVEILLEAAKELAGKA